MKIMKRLAAVLLLFGLGHGAAWAQWSYGVKGGLNFSTFKWKVAEPKYKPGIQLGGFATYHFNEHWGLQAELMYALQGCRFEASVSAAEEKTMMYKRNAHYLNIPVLARFQFGNGLYLALGPQVGFQMAEYGKSQGERYRIEDTKPIDVALAGSLGYAFTEHWELDFRYVQGFLPVTKYWGSDDFKATNRSMQLSLGYRF